MFGRPRITDSISVSEMMHMREEGMSNQQIADRLDISIGAVYSHIGKQPKEMTEHNLANKKSRKDKKLPVAESLPANTQVPELPRESFKERCERMANELHCNPTHWVPDVCAPTTEEILAARKALPAEDLPRMPTPPLLSDRIDELVSVFGKMVVIEYIRCRLYEIGMIEDAVVVDREGLLTKLNSLRGGVSLD